MHTGGLHHIELNVADLERSTEFWSWFLTALGYILYQEWPLGRSWKLEETYIVIVQTEEKHLDVPYHRSRVGLNHLAFHAESREFVDRITKELHTRKIKVLYGDRHPHAGGKNTYAVFFEDPDRIKVELTAS